MRLAAILAETSGRVPGATHVGRNRAVSTAYYAVFHALARLCATELAGLRPSKDACRHIYRSIEHTTCKSVLKRALEDSSTSEALATAARIFIELQGKRHDADYDPFFYVKSRREIALLLADAASALDGIDRIAGSERKLLAARLIGRTRR